MLAQFPTRVALNGPIPSGSWPLLERFGDAYYYASVSRAVYTLNQPLVIESDTPSQYYHDLRLLNACMGLNIVRVRRCSHSDIRSIFLQVT